MCFVDLDRFKAVNDTYGHQVGDEVLVSVATRLRHAVRAEDVAARLGGDEFVVLCEQLDDVAQLRAVTTRLLADLGAPHETSAGPIACGASIGVAFARAPDDAAALLARADGALYRSKAAGRGRIEFADEPDEPAERA